MSRKTELKKEIDDLEREIDALEKKRQRSQSALLTAVLRKKPANPEDEEFFRVFSELIDADREKLRALYRELDELKGGKKKKEDK